MTSPAPEAATSSPVPSTSSSSTLTPAPPIPAQLGTKRRATNSNDDDCIEARRRRLLENIAFEEIVRLAHSAVTNSPGSNGPLSPLAAAQAYALEQIHLRGELFSSRLF
ncbi:unnamed protein product, partial [Mesorhabditis spiculigera]